MLGVRGHNGSQSSTMPVGGYRPGIPQNDQPYTKWDADKDEVEVDYKQMGANQKGSWFSGYKGIVLKVLLLVVIFLLGLIIGYVLRRSVHENLLNPIRRCPYNNGFEGYDIGVSQRATELISVKQLRENMRNYTIDVHITGTEKNNELRNKLQEQFKSFNMDRVHEATYHVLVSYPDWTRPNANTIYLLNNTGQVAYQTMYRRGDEQHHPELRTPYNAYAPNQTVEGELVYANYGEEVDFKTLSDKGISCNGTIVLMRYGKLYRGTKVVNAAQRGAVGVILYSDPAEVTEHHKQMDPEHSYPASWNLPGWAAQSGSILAVSEGDPLTPGLPSKEGVYRLPQEDAGLPQIPSQPIGYDDAFELMRFMQGPTAQDFNGVSKTDIHYRMGPGYDAPRQNWTVRLEVNNENTLRDITNVFGTIQGNEEPDRYVIVGCHYDAWTFGAVDPNAGTSVLMETARVLAQLKKEDKWRPRRTIIFANWDAEEQAMIGSYEWVEDHLKELADRTVAYINLDMSIRGNYTFNLKATPEIGPMMVNVTNSFPPAAPIKGANGTQSMYDVWVKRTPSENEQQKPKVHLAAGGSDQAAFLYMLGVPVLFPRYIHDDSTSGIGVPAYHTAIDNFDYFNTYIDPGFSATESLTKVIIETVLRLACSTKLPLDVRKLAHVVQAEFDSLRVLLEEDLSQLDFLKEAISNFNTAALKFHDKFQQIDVTDVLEVQRYNDRVMKASQAFIHSPGLPGRPQVRNVLFSPSAVSSSSGQTFTWIRDAFTNYSNHKSDPELQKALQRQISIALLAVESATHTLTDLFSPV